MDNTGTASANSPTPAYSPYAAALILLGSLVPLPIVATIVTAALYITPISPALVTILPAWVAPSWSVCIAGFVITLIYWLLFALPFRAFSSVESAIPLTGNDLKNHFLTVRAGFNALLALEGTGTIAPREGTYGYHLTSEQVKCYLSELEILLRCQDMRWITGVGYLAGWGLVHRAEEAMITLEPREEVIREALYDELCLEGSDIETRELVLDKLRRAVAHLSPSATGYLDSQPGNAPSQGSEAAGGVAPALIPSNGLAGHAPPGMPVATGNSGTTASGASAAAAGDTSPALTEEALPGSAGGPNDPTAHEMPIALAKEPGNHSSPQTPMLKDEPPVTINGTSATYLTTELEARSALRDVRRAINEYREGLWEGLVTIRNQLMGAALITALSTYVLLAIALIAGAPQAAILAATIFYSVGALVGLFGRLYIESQAEHAADDYALTLARIIVMPLLAGLAAVGGVLLTAMLSLTLLKSPTSQVSSPQLGLGAIYNLSSNALGIVIAAVFGLTPNLLINALQSKAKDLTDQLQSSTTSNQ